MENNTVTVNEAKHLLRLAIKQYLQKDRHGAYLFDRRHARPICLMGPAGVGKTELVEQVAKEENLAFLSYSITHHTRQSLLGLPTIVQEQLGNEEITATQYTLSELFAAMKREMNRTGKTEGVLFLDEFNSASATIQPVLLQLLQSKQLGTHQMPEGWLVVTAGNPLDYNNSAGQLDAVTADRMRILWIQPDLNEWLEYMGKKGGHPAISSYLNQNESYFMVYEKENDVPQIVTPRAWEDLSYLLQFYESQNEKVTNAAISQVIQSPKVAKNFGIFYRKREQAFIKKTLKALLQGEEPPLELLVDLPQRDLWALTCALIEMCLRAFGETKKRDDEINTVYPLLKAACKSQNPMEYLQHSQDSMTEKQMAFFQRYMENNLTDSEGVQLKQEFNTKLRQDYTAALEHACQLLDRSTCLLRQICDKSPQLEYFMEAIVHDPACQQMLPHKKVPSFSELVNQFYSQASTSLKRFRGKT